MTNPKKTSKTNNKPTIQINRRDGGKKKPDLFANLRNREHPLDEMFPSLPTANVEASEKPDIQTENIEISKSDDAGYPNIKSLDIQKDGTGNPNVTNLDNQIINPGYPGTGKSGIQKEKSSYPNHQNLDSLIAKDASRISKTPEALDSKKSKTENLDIQNEQVKGKFAKYDAKRQKKGIFLRTDDGITKKFKQFCIANDWDFAQGTEIAWNKLMVDLDIQAVGGLDSKIAHDDRRMMLISKTKAPIINLYLTYNSILNPKTKWTVKDDDAGSRLNDVDLRIIELGILQTQAQKNFKGRVNSFNYYLPEIENFLGLEINSETLDVMIRLNRSTWERATGKKLDLSFLEEGSDE